MISAEVVLGAFDAVEKAGLDYIVVGALASNAYTFARATKDVDFVLGANLGAIDVVAPHLPPNFRIDPQPRMELSTGTFRWIVKVENSDFMVELFHLSSDPHHQEEFRRKQEIFLPTFGRRIWIATAEDLIIQKLRLSRPKDLEIVSI